MENKNFYGLDLLRGIAGYGVAITHYLYFVQERIDFEYYSFIFVEIFFVLSGFVLSKQLLKSGTSVGAMIREAEHGESKLDFIHKLAIAQKECNETL